MTGVSGFDNVVIGRFRWILVIINKLVLLVVKVKNSLVCIFVLRV